MVRPVQRHQYLQRLRSVLGRSLQVLLPRLQWKEALVKTKGLRPARRDQQERLLLRLQREESRLQRLRSVLGRSLQHLLLRLQWKEIHSLVTIECFIISFLIKWWWGL